MKTNDPWFPHDQGHIDWLPIIFWGVLILLAVLSITGAIDLSPITNADIRNQ